MILTVNFFAEVSKMKFEVPQSLLYLSGGIAPVELAFYLRHKDESH